MGPRDQIYPGRIPRIECSESTISFTSPGAKRPSELIARPAQVPVGGTVSILGSNLSGDRVELELTGPGWHAPELLPIVSWSQDSVTEKLQAVIDSRVGGREIVPGMYMVAAVVTSNLIMPGGSTHEVHHRSNTTPFSVTPTVSVRDDGAGFYTVAGGLFKHPTDINPHQILVLAESEELSMVTGEPAEGEFQIIDPHKILLKLSSGHFSGSYVALHIQVNGVGSTPTWIKVSP